MATKIKRSIKGNVFLEYALIIGIVAAALITIQLYVKRGLQGRVRQMTDVFIGETQVSQVDKEVVSGSLTTTEPFGPMTRTERRQFLPGGATSREYTEDKKTEAESRTEDVAQSGWLSLFDSFVNVDAVEYDPEGNYTDDTGYMGEGDWWEEVTDIAVLQAEIDRLNEEIAYLNEGSGTIGEEGNNMMDMISQLLGSFGGSGLIGDILSDLLGVSSEGESSGQEIEIINNRISQIQDEIARIEQRINELGG